MFENQKHKQTNATVNCRSHRKKNVKAQTLVTNTGNKHSKYQKPTQNPEQPQGRNTAIELNKI